MREFKPAFFPEELGRTVSGKGTLMDVGRSWRRNSQVRQGFVELSPTREPWHGGVGGILSMKQARTFGRVYHARVVGGHSVASAEARSTEW